MGGNTRKYLEAWLELWRQTDTAYCRLLRRWNLSLNAYLVLELLYQRPEGVEPAEIADTISILRQSVTVILRDFENAGMIIRRESKEDHRRKKILLSAQGRQKADEIVGTVSGIELEALSRMSSEEQKQVVELSARYCRLFRELSE